MKGVQTILKASSEVIKKGTTVKDVIKLTFKPTFGAVLGATSDQVAFQLIDMRDNQNDAPSHNLPIIVPEFV